MPVIVEDLLKKQIIVVKEIKAKFFKKVFKKDFKKYSNLIKGKEMIRIVFLGATQFSKQLFQFLRTITNVKIEAVFSIPKTFHISYSKKPVENCNYANMARLASELEIPNYIINNGKGNNLSDYTGEIEKIAPDVILVLGWYYKIPTNILNIPKYGTWGIHNSYLPRYAGGAPLVWAIINGEEETGVTLFRMNKKMDAGDIIKQKRISIKFEDTIKEVYQKATEQSKILLKEVFENFKQIKFTPQDQSKLEYFPQRSPEDGEIDKTKTAEEIYNFIRAQTNPYPGAFIRTIDGKKIVIEKARIED